MNPKAIDLRDNKYPKVSIQLLWNGQNVTSLSMPGFDPRFADEDTATKKILHYIELREEHSKRINDNTVPEWNEFIAHYGLAEYRYKKPA